MLLEDLRALAAVVECGSVTKASERLRLTQSAVSRRLQSLEDSLGVSLFDRSIRPPTATPLGFRIYEGALGLLRDAEQLKSIPLEAATPQGKFKIGFIQVVADAVVLEAVTSIRKTFPALEIQVITEWSSELERQLVKGRIDAVTLQLPVPSALPQGIEGTLITTLDILVVQSKLHPLVKPGSDIRKLSSSEWILNPKGCGYRAALELAFGAHGKKLKVGVDTHGAAIQMRMVAAGLGLGLLPRRLLQESPLRHGLSVVDVSDFNLQMDVWVAHPIRPGNLKQANDLLTRHVVEGFRG